MTYRLLLTVVVALCVAGVSAWADEEAAPSEPAGLKVGDKAPDFNLPAPKEGSPDASAPTRLSDFRGKKNVLLAFYPKADTPGCTTQLCGYRDNFETFKAVDTEVIAISVDQQADSDKFRDKFSMPFYVLGDPSRKIIAAYGVPLKEREGHRFAQRSVFLIDKEGVLQYIDLDYGLMNDDKSLLYAAMQKATQPAEGEEKG